MNTDINISKTNIDIVKFNTQLDEIKTPCIIKFFKDINLLRFLTTYINIDDLLSNRFKSKRYHKIKINDKIDNIDNNHEDHMQNIDDEINFIYSKTKPNENNQNISLLSNLIPLFPLSEVTTLNSDVIKLSEKSKPDILFYSYNQNTNLSNNDIQSFYKNINELNSCGILCNSHAGIFNKDNFEIDIQGNKIFIFISNHNYNTIFFKVAVKIIYHIYNIIKDNDTIELDKNLFHQLKLEYNYYLSAHTKYINSIKNNIIALENLELTHLEHFFKRTHINQDLKPYNCQLCGTKFGTDKSLKCHLKLKHQIQLTKPRNKHINDHNDNDHNDHNDNDHHNDTFEPIIQSNITSSLMTFD
jgi:hypothetical protein